MATDGKYYVSKMNNSMCRSFAHDARHGIMEGLKEKCNLLIFLVKVPGVGNYILPSEFGYYENARKWI